MATVTIDGAYKNQDATVTTAPTIAWSNTHCSGTTQTAYEVQVGRLPYDDFFCDSGEIASASTSATCTLGSAAEDSGAWPMWYSLRIEMDNVNSTDWMTLPTFVKMIPSWPTNIGVASSGAAGTLDMPSWPAAGGDSEIFYADPNGSAVVDCAAAQVIGTPRTLQKAIDCVDSVDDIVDLANGTYQAQFVVNAKSGDATNPNILRARNANQATIQGPANQEPGLTFSGGSSWWIIDGLRFHSRVDNQAPVLLLSGGSNIEVKNCDVDPNMLGDTVIRANNGFQDGSFHDNLFTGNYDYGIEFSSAATRATATASSTRETSATICSHSRWEPA
jgi:hypothetical protein